MSFLKKIPGTNIEISPLSLGTVKFGRDKAVKYPTTFIIPDDNQVRSLLTLAKDSGINFIDTAPAYGNSEARLGKLIENRQDWVIATKVGEEFHAGQSSFDFSKAHTTMSIERSLRRLKTDYLDIVLIHSDGNDLNILQQTDCLETLKDFQQKGLIKAVGMSTKTIAGGILAVDLMDIVMITYNLQQQDQAVLDYAHKNSCGVLVKKGLLSGHFQNIENFATINNNSKDPIRNSLEFILQHSGIHSVIVGTINPEHLIHNIKLAKEILAEH